MTAVERLNSAAFRRRLQYFQTKRFERRFDGICEKIVAGYRPTARELFTALDCTVEEWAVHLTLIDATRAARGEMPVHGFPILEASASVPSTSR